MDQLRVVACEAEVERRERGRGAGDADGGLHAVGDASRARPPRSAPRARRGRRRAPRDRPRPPTASAPWPARSRRRATTCAARPAASPVANSVEPPPTSITDRAPASGGRPGVHAAEASARASVVAVARRGSGSPSRRGCARGTPAPLALSRTALVATARRDVGAGLAGHGVVAAQGGQRALHRGVVEPPVAVDAGAEACDLRAGARPRSAARPSTSATSRRVEFVPRSATATRVTAGGRLAAAPRRGSPSTRMPRCAPSQPSAARSAQRSMRVSACRSVSRSRRRVEREQRLEPRLPPARTVRRRRSARAPPTRAAATPTTTSQAATSPSSDARPGRGSYRCAGTVPGLPLERRGRILRRTGAGWSSPVARRAHNPKVAGSNPAPATP